MSEAFQVYTNSLSRLWPVRLFAKDKEDEFVELHDLDTACNAILLNLGVYVYEETDKTADINYGKLRFVKIKNLTSIQGPIPYKASDQLSLKDILSLSEATKLWGLKDSSTLRKAMERDKFYESEMRKADNVWLITYPAMQRLFEARTVKEVNADKYPAIVITESEVDDSYGISENDKVSPKHVSPFSQFKSVNKGEESK